MFMVMDTSRKWFWEEHKEAGNSPHWLHPSSQVVWARVQIEGHRHYEKVMDIILWCCTNRLLLSAGEQLATWDHRWPSHRTPLRSCCLPTHMLMLSFQVWPSIFPPDQTNEISLFERYWMKRDFVIIIMLLNTIVPVCFHVQIKLLSKMNWQAEMYFFCCLEMEMELQKMELTPDLPHKIAK